MRTDLDTYEQLLNDNQFPIYTHSPEESVEAEEPVEQTSEEQ